MAPEDRGPAYALSAPRPRKSWAETEAAGELEYGCHRNAEVVVIQFLLRRVFPELELFPSSEEAKSCMGVCPCTPVATALCPCAVVSQCVRLRCGIPRFIANPKHACYVRYDRRSKPRWRSWGSLESRLRSRRSVRRTLRRHLNSIGVPVCMCCGYNLRGAVSTNCPECGASR